MKENFLLFRLKSRLKVNFHKSLFVRLNISQSLLEEVVDALNCRVGSTPFKYHGLPIEANPNRLLTWQLVIDVVRSRLSRWKHKKLSIGVRVVIIKAMLSVILVYFLSFFKALSGITSKLKCLFK